MTEQMKLDPLLYELSSSSDPQKHTTAALMIENGADVNGIDAEGNSLLHVAVKNEAFAVIEAMTKRKRQIVLTKEVVFEPKKNPIALAMRSPNAVELLTLLYKYYRYLNFANCCKLLPWDMSQDHLGKVMRTVLQLTGQTKESDIAHWINSFIWDNRKLAELLIFCTTRTDKRMVNVQNLLTHNCCLAKSDTIALLIRAGAKFDYCVNNEKQYLLHLVCRNWRRDAVFLLLHLGADVNVTDKSGKTPFSMSFKDDWEYLFDIIRNNMMTIMIQHFVRLKVAGKKINEQDLLAIREKSKLQIYYDSCMKEMERMKTVEAADGFPFYWFFSKTSYQLSLLVRDTNVYNQVTKNLTQLEAGVFPTYKDEVIVKFGLAKQISELVVLRERELEEVFSEVLPCLVVRKISVYSLDLKNFEKDHYLNKYHYYF